MSKKLKDKAIGIKVDQETYDRINAVCDEIDASMAHFITGSIDACLEIVEAEPNADVKLPKFLAVTRLRRHWDDIDYEGDVLIKRDSSLGV